MTITSLPTICEAQDAIRSGVLGPTQLVDYCIQQIDKQEGTIKAWVFVDEEGARAEAQRQEEQLRNGIYPGPLTGIPIGIKDIIDVKGWPTLAGSPLRSLYPVAAHDASLVSRLRAAGAILLGKTVTTQYAHLDPPMTVHPMDANRTPGGSSSGSAAAVATEMCMAAIGTQTGGSIIRPSSYCGVVGFKPSFARIPTDGVIPVSQHMDHVGPIARCVSDAEAIFKVLAGDYYQNSSEIHTVPRFHLFQDFFDEASESVRHVTLAAVHSIWQEAEPAQIRLPFLHEEVQRHFSLIVSVDAAIYHQSGFHMHPEGFSPKLSQLIQDGQQVFAVNYISALQAQDSMRNQVDHFFAEGVVAVMPATTTTAPDRSSTGDPRFNMLWSFLGLPSITIPCGYPSEDRLPCGLQLVSQKGSEALLLKAAIFCEEVLQVSSSSC